MSDDDFVDIASRSSYQLQPNEESITKINPGERYSAEQLYAATSSLLLNSGWRAAGVVSTQTDHQGIETRHIFTKTNTFGHQVVTPPASDTNDSAIDPRGFGLENYTIEKALSDGLKALGGARPGTISVKIAQNRKMFKFGPRREHWTHLAVKIDSTGAVTSTHTDSKGLLSRAYDLDPIKNAVHKVFPEAVFRAKYTGHQEISDDNNCGRFAVAYEYATCTMQDGIKSFKNSRSDPLQYAINSLAIDAHCNEYAPTTTTQAKESLDKTNIQISTPRTPKNAAKTKEREI